MKTSVKLIALASGLIGGLAYAACCDTNNGKDATPATAKAEVPDCNGACAPTPPSTPSAAKSATATTEKAEGYKHIDTAGVQAAVKEGKAVILDARAGKWDDGRRIPGAKQLSAADAVEKAATLIPAKDSRIIVYCANTHCPASKFLAEALVKLGYTNVEKYPDGIEGWAAAGNPVEAPKKK